MIGVRKWQIVSILLVSIFMISRPAHALFEAGPVLTFETFKRTIPEEADVVRWGGGVNFGIDLIPEVLTLELGGFYTQENTTFASTNTWTETDYRGRIGPFVTLLGGGVMRIGVRAGLQYDRLSDSYFIKVNDNNIQSSTEFWTPYFGIGAILISFSGFGVQGGVTLWDDKQNSSWVPEAYLGIILN